MERPEALDSGSIILTGFDTNIVMDSIKVVIDQYQENNRQGSVPIEYLIPDVSKRVLNLILGTSRLSNMWDGIR
jgi:UDP-N-acetylglucosamine 2-epimerase (non-hydrolysing)